MEKSRVSLEYTISVEADDSVKVNFDKVTAAAGDVITFTVEIDNTEKWVSGVTLYNGDQTLMLLPDANGEWDDVIADAKAEFEKAYENANIVLKRATTTPKEVTQAEVDDAACALIKTFQYLELKADKNMLRALIALAESITGNADKYIPQSISGLAGVTAEAKKTEADGNALNQEINQAVISLIDELNKARLCPDKNDDTGSKGK